MSCTQETSDDYLFRLVKNSGITFNNTLNHTQELNPYTYRNYYNGAGTAIADFDNDGLEDLFFTGNQVSNKIYKNLGDWKFKDVTHLSEVDCTGSWCTGVSVVDINNDGLKDIYICKAGPPVGERRYNELFINKGNFEFEEEGEKYGLRIKGFSVHASFFDFDQDGDLDCYLLNNSLRSVGGYDLREGLRNIDSDDGNMLLVNEEGAYVNKSKELGIYTSAIGFGLGVNTSDINGDGWKDIYVANDFFEKDYLYINQEGKGFIEQGEDYFNSFSMGSMGVDVADIDNDGDKDIFVAEMAPVGLKRKKTKATYESWNKYARAVKSGYHHQYPRNMLHMNSGVSFDDVSRSHEMESSEWSWAPLIFDMDNDGDKDIFISNGVGKDLLDRDYLAFMANEQQVNDLLANRNNESLKKLIDIMPSEKQENCFFQKDINGEFQKLKKPYEGFLSTISNGSAIGDLDNDGDYDMIISNIDDEALLLENLSGNNHIKINLSADQSTIGAEITLEVEGRKLYFENNPYRGFQSSISQDIIAGIGEAMAVENVVVSWPDGTVEEFGSYEVNSVVTLKKGSGSSTNKNSEKSEQIVLTEQFTIPIEYPPRIFNEFNKEKLLTSMLPSHGAVMDLAKVDDDITLMVYSGAQNVPMKAVIQTQDEMVQLDTTMFMSDFRSHNTDLHIFDSDGDDDLDIGVCHGSRVFSIYSTELHDGLYVNDGNFNFTYLSNAFGFKEPVVSSKMITYDFNSDGLEDVLIAERVSKEVYGSPCRIFYFQNEGANQFSLSDTYETSTGMITDMNIGDLGGDNQLEIIVSGEWQSILALRIRDGRVTDVTREFGLDDQKGLWRRVEVMDVDGDGDEDIIAANQGTNSFYDNDIKLYVNDFDQNGRGEQITTQAIEGKDYPIHDYDEIVSQLPIVRTKAQSYAEYAEKSMEELFSYEVVDKSLVYELDELRSGVYWNDKGQFIFEPFPNEVQQSSMHAIAVSDVNNDGINDIIIGGNHYLYKPQYGRDDASRGYVVLGERTEDDFKWGDTKSLNLNGEIRDIRMDDEGELWISRQGKDLIKYKLTYED